jgi:hypothetical protein
LSDGLNYFLGALIREMAVDNQNGVNHARYPEQQRQKNIKNKLNGFAAQQYGKRGKNDGKKVSHFWHLCLH